MKTQWTDLRTVIGLFLLTVALILFATYFWGTSDLVSGVHLNLLSGAMMAAVGLFMTISGLRSK